MSCFKNTEGISVTSLIYSHLLLVTEIFTALLPANIYCFLHSTLIKIILFIPLEAFLLVDITYISRAHPAECPS